MSETLKERTWRERQEANAAVADALDKFGITETAYNEARLAYNKSLKDQDMAVERNVAAWKEGAIQCDCTQIIWPDMPYVQVEADGVLWHGNENGGGHRADYAKLT